MSPALPIVSSAEVIRALERAGFRQVGQRGSHVKLRGERGQVVIVPLHEEIVRGTLRSVIRQSGLTVDEFVALL